MTDLAEPQLAGAWQDADWTKRRLRRRYRAERRFKAYGIIAVAVALGFLALLIGSVIAEGYPAFVRTSVALEVEFDPKVLGVGETPSREELQKANYGKLLRESVFAAFPEVTARKERRKLLQAGQHRPRASSCASSWWTTPRLSVPRGASGSPHPATWTC